MIHYEVRIEAFGTILESFSDFIKPYQFWLVSTHHQTVHERDARDTLLCVEEDTDEAVKALDLLGIFPFIDLSRCNLLGDVLDEGLESLRDQNESLVKHWFKNLLALLCVMQLLQGCLLFL